ncbi:MAG: hypothetical protein HYU56_04200 [Candidatus Aenigmarchaeota archaeon]|nr:hypothetical protein [Candidatus Aenigmarchaeota archaeon]
MQTAFKGDKSVVIYADHRELSSKAAMILKKHCDLREQLEVAEILYTYWFKYGTYGSK